MAQTSLVPASSAPSPQVLSDVCRGVEARSRGAPRLLSLLPKAAGLLVAKAAPEGEAQRAFGKGGWGRKADERIGRRREQMEIATAVWASAVSWCRSQFACQSAWTK